MSSISKNNYSARSRKDVANVARNRIRSREDRRMSTAQSHDEAHTVTEERLDALNHSHKDDHEKADDACDVEVDNESNDDQTASVDVQAAAQHISNPDTPIDDPLDEIGNPPRVLRICCVPFVIR